MQKLVIFLIGVTLMALSNVIFSKENTELKENSRAPHFTAPNQDGKEFDLASREGKGWTVLYFYPKAGTPGCTKQACAFRDAIQTIRNLGAEVYGISADTVADQKAFHEKHGLKFDLLADPEAKIIELYGAKMPLVKISKRWTFLIDPKLNIRWIEHDVDPMLDAQKVADKIKELST
jgi:peroxiredoxin Q/BCP